jgi:type III secretion protein U
VAQKTEKATPRKLREARKKGQVAKSQDFPSAFTFATSIFLVLTLGSWVFTQLTIGFLEACAMIPSVDWPTQGGAIMNKALMVILTLTLPFVGITTLVGVLINFVIIGPTFAVQGMKPDLKKLDPINGLKQKFKWKTVFELLKSLAKIFIAFYIIYLVVLSDISAIVACAGLPLVASALVVSTILKKVVLDVGIFFLAVAVVDLAFQKKQFGKEMMMEKFEVKQEYKDTEGDPQIKGRRRQLAQEIAYDEGPAAVKRSRAVVTNPIHIAVGIGYEPEKYPAPYITVMGVSGRADTIIRWAEEAEIPIIRDVDLAHSLLEMGQANKYVPEETYEAVAEVLRWVMRLEMTQGKMPS